MRYGLLKDISYQKRVSCLTSMTYFIFRKYEPEYQKDDIVFRTKVYGTTVPIKHIFITESKQALLKRNLIIVTRENKIYTLAR